MAHDAYDHAQRQCLHLPIRALCLAFKLYELGVVSKKVVHPGPWGEAADAGVGSGEVVSVGPGPDGLGSLGR